MQIVSNIHVFIFSSLSIDEDIDKTNDSSHNNQNISDFEGKVVCIHSVQYDKGLYEINN